MLWTGIARHPSRCVLGCVSVELISAGWSFPCGARVFHRWNQAWANVKCRPCSSCSLLYPCSGMHVCFQHGHCNGTNCTSEGAWRTWEVQFSTVSVPEDCMGPRVRVWFPVTLSASRLLYLERHWINKKSRSELWEKQSCVRSLSSF